MESEKSQETVEKESETVIDFQCELSDLVYGMDVVKRSLGSQRDMPILSGVRLQVKEDTLELASTNLEMSTICKIPVSNSGEDGTLILKGDVLAKLTQRMEEDGQVRIKYDPEQDEQVELSHSQITLDLFRMAAEDYPEIPSPPAEPICKLNKEEFRKAIKQTTFAALKARETTRLSLTGVETILEGGQLKMVATNGYRMALKTIQPAESNGEREFLIEAGALSEWDRILSQIETETLSVYASEEEIFFAAGDIIFGDKLIMEEFPEFEGVVPRDNDLPLHLHRSQLLETLRRAQITASEESGAVLFKSEEGGSHVNISSSSPEKGEFEEEIELLEVNKGDIEVSFKAEFLIDALRRMKTENVTFWLSDSDTAGLLEPTEDEEDFIYVCMPISI